MITERSARAPHEPRDPSPDMSLKPRTAGWVVAMAVFVLAYLGGAFLLAHVIAPSIISGASPARLPAAVNTLVLLYFGLTFAAGALAGAMGAWQSGRGGHASRARQAANGLTGPAISIGVLVAIAYSRHLPLPSRPTEANVAIALSASLIGALVAAVHRLGPPSTKYATPDRPFTLHYLPLLLLSALVAHGQPISARLGGEVRGVSLSNAFSGGGNDIPECDCVVSQYENRGAASSRSSASTSGRYSPMAPSGWRMARPKSKWLSEPRVGSASARAISS